jgi:hypothetical protein
MSGIFDPSQFLDSTTTEAAEKRDNLSTGQPYNAELGEVSAKSVQGKKDPTQNYLFFEYPLIIDLKNEYPDIAAKIGLDKLTLKYGASVDLTESGAMDWSKGKNTGLRILREATGTNIPGQAWNARMLTGRRVQVLLKLREYPEGSGNLIEDVKSISKIG